MTTTAAAVSRTRREQTAVTSGSKVCSIYVKIRTGSFTAMGIIDILSRGLMIADLVALIASLDVVAPEIDR